MAKNTTQRTLYTRSMSSILAYVESQNAIVIDVALGNDASLGVWVVYPNHKEPSCFSCNMVSGKWEIAVHH